MIIAHQHLNQLADEDQSGYLLHSVMADARTKLLFGGLDYQDLEAFANNLLLDHFDPWMVKHIQRTPVFAPVESIREVPTYSSSHAFATSLTESITASDSTSHSVQQSRSRGRSVADSVAHSEGEQESYTLGRNSSDTESYNYGTTDTVSSAHTTGAAVSHGRTRGSSISDGTTDGYGTGSARGSSRDAGTSSGSNASESLNMLPPKNAVAFNGPLVGVSTQSGTNANRSASSGTNQMESRSAHHANNHVRSTSDAVNDSTSVISSDTDGRSRGVQEGFGVTHQNGESEAWSRGTTRSTTRGNTVSHSEQVTDGFSDTVGHTDSHSNAVTHGETITRGTAVSMTPFYEYRREEIESPTFLTPEEQKLLMMQKLARIKKMHFSVKAPESSDQIVRAPYVADPMITKRRLAAGLEFVYADLPCFTTLEQQDCEASTSEDDCAADDVIDAEAYEVRAEPTVRALPSPAPTDAETEAALWERWHSMSRGRQEK